MRLSANLKSKLKSEAKHIGLAGLAIIFLIVLEYDDFINRHGRWSRH